MTDGHGSTARRPPGPTRGGPRAPRGAVPRGEAARPDRPSGSRLRPVAHARDVLDIERHRAAERLCKVGGELRGIARGVRVPVIFRSCYFLKTAMKLNKRSQRAPLVI